MKSLKKIPWLTLLIAIGLLWVGIDRMFFDHIEGSDFLANVARILAIVAGLLLMAVSIGLLVAAWRGRPSPEAKSNSLEGDLLTHVFSAAPGAVVFGFCLVRTFQPFGHLYLAATVLFGAILIADLLWTRREVRSCAPSEVAKKAATQFQWSCVFFWMLSFGLGMAMSGWNWFSTDFLRGFNLLFWGAMTCVGIFPVRRDAKRLARAALR